MCCVVCVWCVVCVCVVVVVWWCGVGVFFVSILFFLFLALSFSLSPLFSSLFSSLFSLLFLFLFSLPFSSTNTVERTDQPTRRPTSRPLNIIWRTAGAQQSVLSLFLSPPSSLPLPFHPEKKRGDFLLQEYFRRGNYFILQFFN